VTFYLLVEDNTTPVI